MAVSAVSNLWIEAGAAVEEVKRDYGEDLLVQTAWNGEMDDSRIWVQVKGTRRVDNFTRQGTPRPIRVSTDHVLRWAGSADLVVLVLWDIEAKRGWYALPISQIDRFNVLLSEKKTIGIQFFKENTFTSESVGRLIWESRLLHAAREIGHAQASRELEMVIDRDHSDETRGKSMVATLFLLLRKLGVVVENGISEDFERMVKNFHNNELGTDEFETEELAVMGGIQLALLAFTERTGAGGLPSVLWLALSEQVDRLLRFNHPDFNSWLSS